MTYTEKALSELLEPYSVPKQTLHILLPRYLDIEHDYHAEATRVSQLDYSSSYVEVAPADVPADVATKIGTLRSLDAQLANLQKQRDNIAFNVKAFGYDVNGGSVRRLLSEQEIRDRREDAAAASNANYKRKRARLDALRSVAMKLVGKTVAAVRVKIDGDLLTELDSI
jgi:hypothetical protein